MEIKKGIMLLNESDTEFEHVAINDGILPYSSVTIPRVEYQQHSFVPSFEKDAYLPKANWRGLTEKEKRILAPTEKRTDTNTIYTGKVPAELVELFEQLDLGRCTNRAEVFKHFEQQPAVTKKINELMEHFLNTKANGKPHKIHYLGTNLPNLLTVACDTTVMPKDHREEDKQFMGIHNDGTYYVSFRAVHNSGNRLTINLGKESRYFYFVNLTLSQAYNMIKKKFDLKDFKIDVINISKVFFHCFPNYPVLRIEHKPYEYYIAPTDNCFHDGCTLGKKELDILLVYFGAFRF